VIINDRRYGELVFSAHSVSRPHCTSQYVLFLFLYGVTMHVVPERLIQGDQKVSVHLMITI